jgi:hypothetical protein
LVTRCRYDALRQVEDVAEWPLPVSHKSACSARWRRGGYVRLIYAFEICFRIHQFAAAVQYSPAN